MVYQDMPNENNLLKKALLNLRIVTLCDVCGISGKQPKSLCLYRKVYFFWHTGQMAKRFV